MAIPRTEAETARLLRREIWADAKDIRQMVSAVQNACVELSECGDLVIAGKCDSVERPFELIRACTLVCQLAGGLADHLLADHAWNEDHGI